MNSLVKVRPESAYKVWRKLHGVMAVYKPAGLIPKDVKDTIETAVLQDLNNLKQRPQKSLVKIVPDEVAIAHGNTSAVMAVKVPSLADHPLVSGPRYTHIKAAPMAFGVDRKSSGVMVVAIGEGTKKLEAYRMAKLSKTFMVKGRLGVATDSHDPGGRIREKTTYHHVTREKMDRIVGSIERASQRAIIRHCGVDIQSQEAYELAIRGLLHPVGETNPLILGVKCTQFEPPDFLLEVECLSATAQYLRYVVHDLGLELKSSAVAMQVRCIRDGPFTLDHALLRKHWKLPFIIEAVANCRKLVKQSNLVPPDIRRQVLAVQEEIDESVRIIEGSNVRE